jgi:hypothetical protein
MSSRSHLGLVPRKYVPFSPCPALGIAPDSKVVGAESVGEVQM